MTWNTIPTGSLVVPKILKITKEAEKENFDAAIIGCFYDPGLREAREIAEKLVVTPSSGSLNAYCCDFRAAFFHNCGTD